MSKQDIDLPDLNWSILWDSSNCLICYTSTELNNWSIRHPYIAAGALLCISGNPELILTPLRLAHYTCLLPFRLILWSFKLLPRFILYIFGFRREGVAKGSYASRYQSRRYGGYVPRESTFSKFQAHGATDDYEDGEETESIFAVLVSLITNIGFMFVLGREWGWWY
ncbi:hypothetical protein CY34DRAFT_803744 [Suillus luteus UH-Slu-Lm8-n1]|uniref:Unplaced genomic scaffold CY34scaffold_80, whole genome shotgun sequence n=1 Tax=Suillus luteus UH-Slu-Lm8-n1 TaxID=930992 RepID=A0A0D0BJU3_9AGAM|nr:hypothetical protein CY34DRAFT_803744 [Suillus luteus UH-Slu-Lm8-n1]